jgi:hypothetical protein
MALKSFILRRTSEHDPAGGFVRVRNRRSGRVRAVERAAADVVSAANRSTDSREKCS